MRGGCQPTLSPIRRGLDKPVPLGSANMHSHGRAIALRSKSFMSRDPRIKLRMKSRSDVMRSNRCRTYYRTDNSLIPG